MNISISKYLNDEILLKLEFLEFYFKNITTTFNEKNSGLDKKNKDSFNELHEKFQELVKPLLNRRRTCIPKKCLHWDEWLEKCEITEKLRIKAEIDLNQYNKINYLLAEIADEVYENIQKLKNKNITIDILQLTEFAYTMTYLTTPIIIRKKLKKHSWYSQLKSTFMSILLHIKNFLHYL